jgi:hypothetical protein
LDILALSQHGRTFEAIIVLCSMVKSTRAIADCASDIVRTLSAAGFVLPVRPLETARYVYADQAELSTLTSSPKYH